MKIEKRKKIVGEDVAKIRIYGPALFHFFNE